MADNAQFATPDAFAEQIKSKYPQYKAIPNTELSQRILTKHPQYWDHVDKDGFAKSGITRDGQAPATPNAPAHAATATPPATPAPTAQPENSFKPWTPNWHERLFGGSGGFRGAVQDAQLAGVAGGKMDQLKAFVNHPLAAIDELIFPGNPQTKTGQVLKGATRAVSGLTAPSQLALTAGSYAAGIGEVKSIAGGLHAIGTAMMPTMAVGMVDSAKKIQQARASGDSAAEMDAWGDLGGNIALVAVPHLGGKAIERFSNVDLNRVAQEHSGKKFTELDDQQKMGVLYSLAETKNPKLAKKVEQEVAKINAQKVPGQGGRTVAEVRASEQDALVRQQNERAVKLQAQRYALNQVLRKQAVDEHYRTEQAQAEAKIRAEHEAEPETPVAVKLPAETSVEDQRGFAVNDKRSNTRGDRGYISGTEREKYPVHADKTAPEETTGIPVSDKRSVQDGPLAVDLQTKFEQPVQEFAEQSHGASFSKLPLDQQQQVASHFERASPEQWEAFKGTPAYAAFERHAAAVERMKPAMDRWLTDHPEGSGEDLQSGADAYSGVAQILLTKGDVRAQLKEYPEINRKLNEYSEKHFGQSFDSTLRPKAALSGFLRDSPQYLDLLVTPDVAERLRTGQHVDLANMEAQLTDKRQVQTLMEYRDGTRREMDEQFAGDVVRQEHAEIRDQMDKLVREAPAGETQRTDTIAAQAQGLTSLAENISLDTIADKKDLFGVDRAIQQVPESDRTPEMQQFTQRVRQLRASVQNELVRRYRDKMMEEMRTLSPEPTAAHTALPLRQELYRQEGELPAVTRARRLSDEAIAMVAKEMVQFEDQRHAFIRVADNRSGEYATPKQLAAARDLREAADFIRRKEDALVTAAHVVTGDYQEPAKQPQQIPLVMGRATYIELNNGERVPAHYAIAERGDLITSHRPLQSFSVDPRFPVEAQPRDYQAEKELQASVHVKGNKPNADIYHSDTIRSTDGPPAIRPDGVVMSGNNRTQGAEVAESLGNWQTMVRPDLLEKARNFGINPEEFTKHKQPMLIRVIDQMVTDPTELARLGIEMNRDAGQGMSDTELAAALSRLLTPDVVDRLADIFGSVSADSSLRDAMRARSADLAKVLQDAGLVDPTKRAAYFTDDNELKEMAKALIESALAGRTVSEPKVLDIASPRTKDKLGRVSKDFILMQSAGAIWDLASYNTDAVRLITRAEDQSTYLADLEGLGKHGNPETGAYSAVERMLHPERFRLSNMELTFDGQPTHPPVHPVVEGLAMALEKRPKEYAGLLADYADAASRGGATMFGTAEPWDAFNQHIGEKVGMEPVIPEEWGMVNGLPEATKRVIEDVRENGLPVEPETHVDRVEYDVQPDTSSVDDAEKGDVPRTVSDFRDALASHPNISSEEAAAISDIFEQVLPRAIGQTFSELLGNRRLSLGIGGREAGKRGYTEFIDDVKAKIHLFETANASTVMHEVFHVIRPLLKPEHQKVLNEFVEAKPGQEWTVNQEEKAASAFERYHFDGGRRRGALEKAFSVIHKTMQAVYDAATSMGLVKPSPEVAKMFDNWYDWERTERKPIAARNNVAEIIEKTKDAKVEIPKGAKVLDETSYIEKNAQNFVFTSKEQANDFIDKNSKTIRTYQLLDGKDGAFYVKASFLPGAKRLYQSAGVSITDLARQAKDLEDRLKKTYDPREEARLRAQLNSIENRMGGGGLILGGSRPELRDDEVTQLIYGLGERASVHEPTTPAQAMTEVQIHGDPTKVEVTANGNGDGRTVPDEAARLSEPDGTEEVHGGTGESDRGDEAAGRELPGRKSTGERRGKGISEPKANPLANVKAADVAAPKRARGTPLADPAAWREYSEALGLPAGTPPPTVRLPEDLRDLMIYPGQPEAIEVALSGLQQHDAVVVASPTGSGKTYQFLTIADQLLGGDSSKVGLIVTRSRNLIHGPDGYVDVGQKLGVQVDHLPGDINDVQGGGVYAATYAGIRGDQSVLQVPWDFVIFDESAEARKWNESAQGQAVVMLGHAAKKVVYGSATPFHTAIEVGYMHKLGLWPEGGFFEWARQFGVVETGPNSYTGGYAPKKLMKLRQQMIERGQWISLHRDMEGVSAHVAMVPMDAEARTGVKTIRNAFALAGKVFREQGRAALARATMARATMAHETIYLKRYIESRRLPQVLDAAKKAIAQGYQPVIYSEYRSGTDKGMDFFNRLPPGVGEMVNKMLPPLPDVVAAVRGALGDDAAIFAGEANELREEERAAYMQGKKRAVYATYAAGGVGVSFHDRVGDRPRMGLFLGLPWSGIMFEQSLGRTWRYGTKSDVANVFFSSDALPEMKVLATKILPRMRALNAAVYGEEMETHLAKMLRESSGIPEEMIDYEMGSEAAPSAAEFEQQGEGAHYTAYEDLHLRHARELQNKGMKYKAQPKRLYQSDMGETSEHDKVMSMLSKGKSGAYRLDYWLENQRGVEVSSVERESVNPANLQRVQSWTREGKVSDWQKAKVSTSDMPPVEVVRTKSGDYLYDGTHRAELALRNGEQVPATIYTVDTANLAPRPRLYQSEASAPRFEYSSTQHDIPEDSEAGKALAQMRERIDPKDLVPTGYGGNEHGLEDDPHVTVRFGLRGEDHDEMVAYLERQKPFEAKLGKVTAFPPGPMSNGGAPLISEVISPELHRINGEIGIHGDFAAPSFPDYKPHATIGYVKPEAVSKYVETEENGSATAGKTFKVDRIAISDRNGNKQVIKLKGDENARATGFKRLYQDDPKDLHNDAHESFESLPLDTLPPSMRRAVEANRLRINAAAVDAAKLAVPGVETPRRAIERTTRDSVLNAKMMFAMHDLKNDARATGGFVKTAIRLMFTSGDRAVWKYFEDAGMGKEGKEIQRKLIERNHEITDIRGEYMARVSDITEHLKPGDHAQVVDVLEGNAISDDPRINAAAAGYRELFADIRKRLGDAGAVFNSYDENGKPSKIPWKDFRDNPNYWPHIYDWNQKLIFHGEDGKPFVRTLGELHDMNPGEERDKLIQQWAAKQGINPVKAYTFFAKNRRGVKLAPNLERERQTDLPGYGKDLRSLNIYINQVAEMLANIKTVGQEREKIPELYQLPANIMRTVDSIITADLNPVSVGSDNSRALRRLSQWTVISKMGMSVLKVPTHAFKTALATNMRSAVAGVLQFATHPGDVTRTAREAGILTDYVRQAMMMEYGLHEDSGLDRKMLQTTGFTGAIWLERVIASAAGRQFLTVHAEPMLRANPKDEVVRRKLKDLYAFSDEDLDRIAKDGINEHDVRRSMIAAADWTTGSGRPSELPPMLRAASSDHPIEGFFRTVIRAAYLLKTYEFKTAALVNRTVFDEMKQKNFKPTLRLLIAGGAAGLALNAIQMGVNSVANPEASAEQQSRFKALADHPQGVLWLEGSNLSYALGLYPMKVMFDRLGTYDEGDVKKFTASRRLENASAMEVGGILGSDMDNMRAAAIDFSQTFGDDGVKHKETPEERRAKILNRLLQQEFAPARAVEGVYHLAGKGQVAGPATDFVPHRRTKHVKRHAVAQ